jgi:DNA-binding MarR family transcriptional regulator
VTRRHTDLMATLQGTMVALIRLDTRALTSRQLAVLLVCSLEDGPHTVRELAARLNVGRPAITQTLDRLEAFDLVRRRQDPRDRRSIVVARTPAGDAYVATLRAMMEVAASGA